MAGQTIANAADVKLGDSGQISAQPLTTTNLVIDVYGYFTDVEELAGNNTALGLNALLNNTTGDGNTAVGYQALQNNTTGFQNTATGTDALFSNTTGNNNIATGAFALGDNTTGSGNIAIGVGAGLNGTTGSNNIQINNVGSPGDDAIIRIGTAGDQTRTFIAGIFGATALRGGAG